MSERDILEELKNATPENPLIIDRPLNTKEQVIAFNDNVFGTIANMHEDYKCHFGISGNMLKVVEKEKGQWWGTIEHVARYSMSNCIDMGYIPWKLTYIGFDEKGEDGGSHTFYISCEDRRIIDRESRIEADVRCNGKCSTECTGLGMP